MKRVILKELSYNALEEINHKIHHEVRLLQHKRVNRHEIIISMPNYLKQMLDRAQMQRHTNYHRSDMAQTYMGYELQYSYRNEIAIFTPDMLLYGTEASIVPLEMFKAQQIEFKPKKGHIYPDW